MPLLSMSSSEDAGDHFGGGGRAPARRHHGVDVKLRNEVMMHVDPRLGGGDLRGRGRHAADRRDCPDAQRGHACGQELSPRGVRARRLAA